MNDCPNCLSEMKVDHEQGVVTYECKVCGVTVEEDAIELQERLINGRVHDMIYEARSNFLSPR